MKFLSLIKVWRLFSALSSVALLAWHFTVLAAEFWDDRCLVNFFLRNCPFFLCAKLIMDSL